MFSTLLESRVRRSRRPVATTASIAVHVAIGATLVALTAGATPRPEAPVEQRLQFVAPPAPPPPVASPPAPAPLAVAAVPRGFQLLIAPVVIPDGIPEIDLTQAPTRGEDFSGRGLGGGTAAGTGSQPTTIRTEAFDATQVDRPAAALPGAAPAYPDMLRAAGIEGQALVQFIVDTAGRAEPGSVQVLSTSHELFAHAVRSALPRMRFLPAEVGGRKVRQLVQQPFGFSLTR